MAIAMGCTPIGAPFVGWIADHYGPRWSLALGALSSAIAAFIGGYYFYKQRKISDKAV